MLDNSVFLTTCIRFFKIKSKFINESAFLNDVDLPLKELSKRLGCVHDLCMDSRRNDQLSTIENCLISVAIKLLMFLVIAVTLVLDCGS